MEKETNLIGSIEPAVPPALPEMSIVDDPLYKALKKELWWAGPRLAANLIITAADVFPATEALSWLADGIKGVRVLCQRLGINDQLDFTPDVSFKVAAGTELVEPFTGFVFPSHAIETTGQIMADARRLRTVFRVNRMRVGGASYEEMRDYLVRTSYKDRVYKKIEVQLPKGPLFSGGFPEDFDYRKVIPTTNPSLFG